MMMILAPPTLSFCLVISTWPSWLQDWEWDIWDNSEALQSDEVQSVFGAWLEICKSRQYSISEIVHFGHGLWMLVTTLHKSECVCMFDASGWVVNPYPARSASCLASLWSFTLWAIVPVPEILYWMIENDGMIVNLWLCELSVKMDHANLPLGTVKVFQLT